MTSDEILFSASLSSSVPTVDLHAAHRAAQAESMLQSRLHEFYSSGAKACRVIHGIGKGILTNMVTKELDSNPIVADWTREDHGGSCLVVFA